MRDDILNKVIPDAPAPSAEARERALRAGMAAFEKNLAEPKGNVVEMRPKDRKGMSPVRQSGSPAMTTSTRTYMKVAACLLVSAAAIPIAIHTPGLLTRSQGLGGVAITESSGFAGRHDVSPQPAAPPPYNGGGSSSTVGEAAKAVTPQATNVFAWLRGEDRQVAQAERRQGEPIRSVQGTRPVPPEYNTALEAADRARVAQAQERLNSAIPTIRAPDAQPIQRPEIAQSLPAAPQSTVTNPMAMPQPVAPAPTPHAAKREMSGQAPQFSAASPPALAQVNPDVVMQLPQEQAGRDVFAGQEDSPFKVVAQAPVSTFSLDVDTASYSFARASLARNVLPQRASVRVEEMVNYFPYAYPAPTSASEPFRTTISVFPSPWNAGRQIVHVGIKGYEVAAAERPKANLVFLVDTSGSMSPANRLPLAKQGLSLLVDKLEPGDKVSIVTYAGSSAVALEPTDVSDKRKILAAIDRLGAGGSTAGAQGLATAYSLAHANYDPKGVNRIMLVTDGDFNVGITNRDELKGYVERERGKGVYLSVLGFGMGNYNDATMQALAQNGNGTAAYIDTLSEARKVLVEEASSSIVPIAGDVKIQVEFNPAKVAEYRLVGYETRALRREDFNNDKVDAGEVGSGHTVTALYEIVPAGAPRVNPDLRYAPPSNEARSMSNADEIGFLSMRYKLPGKAESQLATTPIPASGAPETFEAAPQEARFAVAVAGFGELLRGGRHVGSLTYDEVIRQGLAARGDDPFGYRSEFVQLVRQAKAAPALPQRP